ncbi:unnamed protein product [Vitrella brassicaformis CCMP3155]|uniref:Uncharacterized protein n=1 Tax=Vitrella brassicaformis (strain CCMP3155) TaxID=1169540 RepID=A0A0G4GHR9_VITBC|nr:unnamed protein product [Vitrella brassicaformis CCMP3155]|mmetsp:Transcript_20570/g.50099  ORF Transcript_20570/g.50099 Transcript_20570/m.50099 type:complete len:83 (-) Transcript_20570:821-1069(-)|eukprot:CEM29292.1 unnamed protein product [Vitrella brassicaformis CCMP3155]
MKDDALSDTPSSALTVVHTEMTQQEIASHERTKQQLIDEISRQRDEYKPGTSGREMSGSSGVSRQRPNAETGSGGARRPRRS